MTMPRRAVLALAGALPLVLAGRRGARAAEVHEVEIKGMAFSPATLTVRPGDSIRWTNHDLVPHTATADDKNWDTGKIAKGASATLEVKDGVTGRYHCTFHPQMKAAFTAA